MITKNQLVDKKRTRCNVAKKGTRARILRFKPQRKGVCFKITTMKPKKPNSANRKIAKVKLINNKRRVTCAISGIGHDLREFSQVLIRGASLPDLPGVNYKMIKGKYDFSELERIKRIKSRSKYGLKKIRI